MKLSPVFHLKLQHCSNRPHNSAISPSLLHGNVISASSTLFSRYYALWNFAKLLELSTTTRSLNACSPCSSFPSVLLTEPLLLIWKKVSHWNLGANYPSPLQCNGFQLHGIWRRQHMTRRSFRSLGWTLQTYGGSPPGQHRVLPMFGHPELRIYPAGSPFARFGCWY